MIIGVIFHGQLRTGLSCAKYINALFDDYDADFFIDCSGFIRVICRLGSAILVNKTIAWRF